MNCLNAALLAAWILWLHGLNETGRWVPENAYETRLDCMNAGRALVDERIRQYHYLSLGPLTYSTSRGDIDVVCFPDTFDPRGEINPSL